jgi:hypothetical protein
MEKDYPEAFSPLSILAILASQDRQPYNAPFYKAESLKNRMG